MRRALVRALTVAVAVAGTALPGRVRAHDAEKWLRGTCTASNTSGSARIVVTITNNSEDAAKNVNAAELLATNTGDASIFFQSQPRPLRELLAGKTAEFVWKGRLFGNGYLSISHRFTGEFEGAGASSTGIINCSRLAVGNAGVEATPTPSEDEPTPTEGVEPTDTPAGPTPTDEPGRPTRTPRATNTPRPVRTQSATNPPRPTRTPLATEGPRATRTPIATNAPRPTRTPVTSNEPRPTRTPLGGDEPGATSTPRQRPTRVARATRTPISEPTPRPTRTPLAEPTPRPTRTPIGSAATPIVRPTRTPRGDPPATATRDGGVFNRDGLRATCSLRRSGGSGDQIDVTMLVQNNTGMAINNLVASDLEIEPEGTAQLAGTRAPNPRSYGQVGDGGSASFQWSGRLSAGGTMGFSASARGVAENGQEVNIDSIDCGVATAGGGNYDPSDFSGTCSIREGDPGRITLVVSNGGGESLTEIAPRLTGHNSSGSAQILDISGPVPSGTRRLPQGQQATYEWRALILGRGHLSVQFDAAATDSNGQRVSTGPVSCEADLSSGGLPDLTVSEADMRSSARITTNNFAANHCAIEEGCVGGPGTRRLLRFDTVTPNLGPGDLFIGDPAGNPQMVFAECHGHYHFRDYADYRLYDLQGNVVARGHKQAFCLIDLEPTGPGAGGAQFPDCGFQGISAGWSDVYSGALDCQWIDVTGVPEGRYVLEVTINPARVIPEGNYANNTGRVEVVISGQ